MRLRAVQDRAADRAPQVRIGERSTRVDNTAQHDPSSAVLTLRIDASTTGFVSVGDGPQVGNHRAASIAIPGSAVRGAMASLWLRDHPGRAGEDPVFQELFDSTVRWPALDPTGSAVIPLSVRRCKYRPDSGCRDVLVDVAFSVDGEHAGLVQLCPACGGPLELSKGELESFAGGPQVRTLTRTSVQLDEDETAAHGALFSRDGIAADGRLSGRAPITTPLISDEARAWLLALVGRMVRVGGRRSVAGGLEITDAEIDTTTVGAVAAGTRLAMRAAQPVILLDAFGAPSTGPVEFIARTHLTGLRPIDTGTFLRTAPHGGWNGLAGLPKSVDTALVVGSTLVVETERELSADEVAGLLRRGIGPRASEGFGALSIDSAHWAPPVAHEHTGGDQR
jgi:CRISPR-associated protein Csx10